MPDASPELPIPPAPLREHSEEEELLVLPEVQSVSGTRWVLTAALMGTRYCPRSIAAEIEALDEELTYPRWENQDHDCRARAVNPHRAARRSGGQAPSAQGPVRLRAPGPSVTPDSPAPLSIPDLTQTISPRRASMTCTCEGLKNVTSQPSLHSPGAATAGPVSTPVLAGWGRGTLPMRLRAGRGRLPAPRQSPGARGSSPPGCT